MRDHGKTARELSDVFGYHEAHLRDMVALGSIAELRLLAGKDYPEQVVEPITFLEARRYLLPLRILPSDIRKNDKALDYSLYDYSESDECIQSPISGNLKPEDLPTYSAERRVAVHREQQDTTERARTRADCSRNCPCSTFDPRNSFTTAVRARESHKLRSSYD